jgi:hypothetical protein
VNHRTKIRKHQINYIVQRVEDKGRREAMKVTPPPTCAVLTKMGVRVYWERKGAPKLK